MQFRSNLALAYITLVVVEAEVQLVLKELVVLELVEMAVKELRKGKVSREALIVALVVEVLLLLAEQV